MTRLVYWLEPSRRAQRTTPGQLRVHTPYVTLWPWGTPARYFFQTSFVLVFIRVYKPLPMKSAPRIQRGSMGGGGSSSSKPML